MKCCNTGKLPCIVESVTKYWFWPLAILRVVLYLLNQDLWCRAERNAS